MTVDERNYVPAWLQELCIVTINASCKLKILSAAGHACRSTETMAFAS